MSRGKIIQYLEMEFSAEKIFFSKLIGNVTPVAEFNIHVDPLAAHIVFESNLNVYMLPLDVTHTAIFTDKELELVKSIQTPFGKIMHDLLVFYVGSFSAKYGIKEPPLHDPCAAFFLINPLAFDYKLMRVDVEINVKSICYGQTVVDYYDTIKAKNKNVNVFLKMNVDEFWKTLLESFKKAENF